MTQQKAPRPISRSIMIHLLLLSLPMAAQGYASSLSAAVTPAFHSPSFGAASTNPFKKEGLNLELPDFTHLFDKIQQVSPLARKVISGESLEGIRSDSSPDHRETNLPWKTLERKPSATVHQIDKLDGFGGLPIPIFRFRARLKGLLVGELFGKYIIDLEERRKWDAQIEQVREVHPVHDLDAANIAMGFGRFGDCARLGIGYGQTKAAFGITPREQLFLYGLQDFPCGSCLIWGTELDEAHNHLLPAGPRHTRAKSHLFSATLTPVDEDAFDVEYVLQMDIGGNIPKWLTTPVLIDTVKSLFQVAADDFAQGVDKMIADFWRQHRKEEQLAEKQLLLMTP